MSERDNQIIELAKRGLPATKIHERLRLTITVRAVNRVMLRELGPRPSLSNSSDYVIHPSMRPLVIECMARLGKDPMTCEVCEEPQQKPCDIHHTKYEGATIYDLIYACRPCNLSFMNRGLN